MKWWHDCQLIKDCVKSVVYNLKTALAKLEYEIDIAEQEQGCSGHTDEEVKKRIKSARANLWHSVQRMKWLEADGGKVAWVRVKSGKGPRPNYRWVQIDDADHIELIRTSLLPDECAKQKLSVAQADMHRYESLGSGSVPPMVWTAKGRWSDTPLTFGQMRKKWPSVGFNIAMCGPHARPAEDVPADVAAADEKAADETAARNWIQALEADGREEEPAEDVIVDDGFLMIKLKDDAPPSAATAQTAPAAAEAQPPETGEAPLQEPPAKRVSFTDEAQTVTRQLTIPKLNPATRPGNFPTHR